MADTFGTPEISQEAPEQSTGSSRTVIILLILIIGGAAVLGYLLYRQSNEPAPVLEEVTESIEIPTTPTDGVSSETVPADIMPMSEDNLTETLPENTPGGTVNPAE